MAVRTEGLEESFYLFLEYNNEGEYSHAHHLVEDGAEEAHFEHARHEYPQDYKDEDAGEDCAGAGLFHQSIEIVEQACH